MHRQGYDVQLTQYDERGARDVLHHGRGHSATKLHAGSFAAWRAASTISWRARCERCWPSSTVILGCGAPVGLVWPRAAVQRCCVHKLRNLERKAPKHALAEIRDD